MSKELLEWQAHWFALAFLMPEEKFMKAVRDSDLNLEWVADCFRVEKSVAVLRLATMPTEEGKRLYHEYVSRHGERV